MCTIKILIFFLVLAQTRSLNPGVKTRLTEKGLNAVNQVAQSLVARELDKLQLPDQGDDQVSLRNIRKESLTPPQSQMSLSTNGLTWVLRDFSTSIHFDWSYRKKVLFFTIRDSGSATASFSGVSLTLTLAVDLDGNQEPLLRSRGCSANIGDFNLKFHGGNAWLYNLIKGLFQNSIKNKIRDKICELVEKFVNENGARELRTMKTSANVGDLFALDFKLTESLVFTPQFIESRHSGEFYSKTGRTATPLTPAPIPDWPYTDNMLYIWVTDYTAKTAAYVTQSKDFLKYTITKQSLAAKDRNIMDTTCSSRDFCAGSILDSLSENYPNTSIAIDIRSAKTPEVAFTTSGLDLKLYGQLTFTAGGQTFLSCLVTLSLSGTAHIEKEILVGNIVDFSLSVSDVTSTLGDAQIENLNKVLNGVVSTFVQPALNDLANKGVDLPIVKDIRFTNAKLTFYNGYLVVATDVTYTGN
ncbi:bactericidal permeability-increasing protein-like [Physella acuta]|uniref:bactericidal permeability-increasing protein-like n=1 Tax=Physella acuta TaxID=109671 RepID=UPI0027DD3118|nr:bactericidal permeability-increasing protein-like [Physella acuta]